MTARILIVEDDPTIRMALEDAFKAEGYDVTVAPDGLRGEELLFSRHFSLVLLDLMMPGKGGLEVLKQIREASIMTPVILLTARSDENDKVLGLELGADDYVTKPFSLRELLARVRVLLRKEERVLDLLRVEAPAQQFSIGESVVDLETLELNKGEKVWPLTPKEAAMLHLFFRESGKIISRGRFLSEVWGGGEAVTNRTVDTHILNLRKKLEHDPKEPQFLITVHGAGYKMVLTTS
ncbi:MAG: DNA-binding response OmpR family regulator [Planctomycetota bacterium]|jgi:DNA-binding response OmpR family regulator